MGAASRQLAILSGHDEPEPGRVPSRAEKVRGRFVEVSARVGAFIERQPSSRTFLFGLNLIGIVCVTSLLAGDALSLTPLYLAPLILVAWASSRAAGIVCALVSTIAWSVVSVAGTSLEWAGFAVYWNVIAQLGTFLIVAIIVSGLRKALEAQKELARTDPVTRAPNSRAFFEQLDRELARSLRYGHPFTVAYLDADNFKRINDQFGHSVGDTVLRTVVETVQAHIRTSDHFARIAGDEFTLLMPETGHKESELVMARVRKALSVSMQSNNWPTTFSMGVVTYVTPPPSLDALLRVADDVMYSVKHGGKDAVRHSVYGERKGAA